MCARCNDEIVGEENGLVAMDGMYHVLHVLCVDVVYMVCIFIQWKINLIVNHVIL